MAAPVRNSIELDAVGELHVVLRLQPLSLLRSLVPSSALAVLNVFAHLDLAVVAELVLVAVGYRHKRVGPRGRGAPSSLATTPSVVDAAACRASAGNRGGTVGAGRGRNGGGRVVQSRMEGMWPVCSRGLLSCFVKLAGSDFGVDAPINHVL